MSRIAVVAFGGDALLRVNQRGLLSGQIKHADEICRAILPVLEHGYEVAIVHGSRPQLENVLIQVEESINKVPPQSLDVCVAQTQGSVGYLLEQSMMRILQQRGISKAVVGIITRVVVDPQDPAFREPAIPVGPCFLEYRAHDLMRRARWKMVEEPGKGYRRMLPAPLPTEIVPAEAIKRLLAEGFLVIAAGGGGIPATRDDQGHLWGVEAVIDKDHAAALLATELGADFLLLLSEVDRVFLHNGKTRQDPLAELTVEDAQRCLSEGQFPQQNIGPKLRAAVAFIERGGREVLITSARKLQSALMGRTGTRIYQDGRRLERNRLQMWLPFTQDRDES